MWRQRMVSLPLILAVLVTVNPLIAEAQLDGLPSSRSPAQVRWWHGAILVGGLSALMLLDHPTRDFFQSNRSAHSDDIAGVLRHFGQPEVYGTVTLGLLGAGLISGHDEVTRAGSRLAATLVVAGLTSTGLKSVVGRPRPNESSDVDGFVPFSGQDAMPSGHTTIAFAVATALADDIHRTWASAGLYAVATGVGWSRMNDNKHWLSDVAGGAVLGIASAKVMNGRWRIFNLHPPKVLLGPQSAGIAWQFTF